MNAKPPTTRFDELLAADAEGLVNLVYPLAAVEEPEMDKRLARACMRLGLHRQQLVCAAGFNSRIRPLRDVLLILGFTSYEDLARQRNEVFVSDIYHYLSMENVLSIYAAVRSDSDLLDVMQYLLLQRLQNVEKRIEATVNSLVIERYKKEMRAIYSGGVARIDFAEARLNNTESGFRALLNEVSIIVEAKLIPVGDVFFRETVLPEEKRRLINKGVIPVELIRARLEDNAITAQERRMLEDNLARITSSAG
ncbi:MAG: hypothetical protein AB7Q97_14345 [Gammaproteobacteria bacterium]